jgi:hypothetical protein
MYSKEEICLHCFSLTFMRGSDQQRQNLRQMNDTCSKALDATCQNTGLYQTMAINPPLSPPLSSGMRQSQNNYPEYNCSIGLLAVSPENRSPQITEV